MSNYIPGGQKKNKIFKKREIELVHAIKNDYDKSKITSAAEKLREAKLQAINVQSTYSKKVSAEESISRRKANREKWESLTIQDIIDIYLKKSLKS